MTDLSGALYRVIAPEFTDIASSTFLDAIHWIFYEGITVGCGNGRFCPTSPVTREQMAIFLVRAFNHPSTSTDYFTDDDGLSGESSINALRAANITSGCGSPTLYCPTRPVTREEMAIFLDKELNLPLAPAGTDFFDDDDGQSGESSINALAPPGRPAAAARASTARRPASPAARWRHSCGGRSTSALVGAFRAGRPAPDVQSARWRSISTTRRRPRSGARSSTRCCRS